MSRLETNVPKRNLQRDNDVEIFSVQIGKILCAGSEKAI